MAGAEKAEQQDPLVVINQFHRERVDYRNLKLKTTGALISGGTGMLVAIIIGTPEVAIASLAIQAGASLYMLQHATRWMYRLVRHRLISNDRLQEAGTQIKTAGETLEDDHTMEEFFRYGLAQRIRATKLYLAQQGKLREYQKFNWLQTTRIPKGLRPTQTELDEVDRWGKEQDTQLANFVDALSRQTEVIIECGQEILPEATKVYLFEDPRDPWKNKSQPLLNVMRTLLARKTDLQTVNARNTITLFQNPNYYEGIFSAIGRQRITDFFGKPTHFYTGAEQIRSKVNRYGVLEDEIATINSLPEHFWRLSMRRAEPFSRIEKVEPTATRLENLGLVLARA